MFRETGKFEAMGSDGLRYTVLEFMDLVDGSSGVEGEPTPATGPKGYRLSPQQTRVHVDNGKFIIDGTDIVLTPMDRAIADDE